MLTGQKRVKKRDHKRATYRVEPIEPRVLLSKTIYVDANQTGATHDGASWNTAFADLQQGLAAAVWGDEIRVADGTYKPTSGTDRTISFALKSGVSLYGGYAGYGAANPDARDIAVYSTILSGEIGSASDVYDNSYHVVTASGIAAAVMDGLSVTLGAAYGIGNEMTSGGGLYATGVSSLTLNNCNFTANKVAVRGAGLYNYASSLTLTRCTFSGNNAGSGNGSGGGIYNDSSSSPTLTNCTFINNLAGSGGGMYSYSYTSSSSPILNNCIFSQNRATTRGGGLYNVSRSSPTLTNCTFSDNSAGQEGGGMYNSSASPSVPILANCIFSGNSASQGGAIFNMSFSLALTQCTFSKNTAGKQGGAMYNTAIHFPSSTTLTDCTFTSNAASGDGGGIYDYRASLTINNCTFDQNRASSYGGAMYVSSYAPFFPIVLTGCTFTANTADYGAGIANMVSPTQLTDCTFSGNMARWQGGGFYASSSAPTLTNCAFSGNFADLGGGMYNAPSSSSLVTHSIFSGNTAYHYGGGMYNSASSPLLTGCSFSGNSGIRGGAIYNDAASPTLINSTFSANSAFYYGGWMYNDASSPTITNCTASGNTASTSGGALYNDNSSSPTLTNCIVWGSGVNPIYNISGTPAVSYSDIEGGYGGTGNINLDPRFIAGPNDLRLQTTSPCIDAGNNSAVPTGVTTDAAGNSRIIDYPGVHDPGAIVDLGAYERPLSLAVTGGAFLTDGPQPNAKFALNNQLDSSSISAADVTVRTVLSNGTLGSAVNVSGLSYDPASSEIHLNLPVTLLDSNYRATLLAGSVTDTYGNSLPGAYSFDFFFLRGDANRDRKVDLSDLAILAANWKGSGKVFSEGDFNYDGKVDSADLGILSANWQNNLPPPAAPATPLGANRTPTRSPVRVISLID